MGGRNRRLFPRTRSRRRGDLGFTVKQQTDTTFDMVVITNGETGKHPDFIKRVFLGVRSSPQQSRYLANKMLKPSVKTRSIELSSYILINKTCAIAPPLFALQQALCMRQCQDEISLSMSLKTLKPTPLYSIKVYVFWAWCKAMIANRHFW